jgi:hypothetical protein
VNQNQIKIYSFSRENINGGVIENENLEEFKVTLTDNFLLFALEAYKNQKFENEQLIEEIIKVMLPNESVNAKEEWNNGLSFNGNQYYAWFATTGGMKKEENEGICETIFIREDIKAFVIEFEELISLGKFKEIEESNQEICINKDVLSRISLALSSCHVAGDMPNFIILPQPLFKLTKDYKTVEKVKTAEGNVDYNLIDYHFDGEIDVFDGGAIATPDVFKQIEKALGMDYSAEFAIIRGYGLGMKGMITKFDIIGYLDAFYTSDTEYCRKVDGKYQFLDMWKEWQNVTPKTMLLNESMVKLAKYHNGMDSYKQRLKNVDSKYKDIIGKLYVTKVNKKDSDIEEYRRTNYQLINALALNKQDYSDLIKEDLKAYRKIIKPFAKSENDEWQINLDAIKLFFKSIVRNNNTESEEFTEEVKRVSNNIVNKCEELLNLSDDFIKLKFVRNNLAKLIEKKCRELALGKFTVKAKYQYIAICPISYMNLAMFGEQGNVGLETGEFYSADCENEAVRTISRNPLCAYSEVHNVLFVKNEFLDKWLSPCRELIYFNQKSDILALMSSADTDGDACTVIDNEIIRNAVVIPQDGKYFINVDDGEKKMMVYNAENRFIATYKASGNLIGKISLKSASINSNSQVVPDYYNVQNGEFVFYRDIDITEKEERKAFIKDKLDTGEWVTSYNAGNQLKELMRQRFYENEKDIYIVLYNAMVSIDAPKTLYFPSNEDMKVINKKYGRKASFLQYKENSEDVEPNNYEYTSGLLDVFSNEIKRYLLDEIQSVINRFDNRPHLIQEKLINGDYRIEDYNLCAEEITALYESYTEERKSANNAFLSRNRKIKKVRNEEITSGQWNKFFEEHHNILINELREAKFKQFKEIDAKYILLADEKMQNFDMATIANAIGNLKNCTEDFIINLFYPVFEYLNVKLKGERYVYVKDNEGEIYYLHDRYKKVPVFNIDNRSIVLNLHLEEKKRLKAIAIKSDIRARVLNDDAISLIESELKDNGHLVFNVATIDGRVILSKDDVPMLQVFDDKMQIGDYNLLMCESVKIEMLVEVAKSRKSVKLTATAINV